MVPGGPWWSLVASVASSWALVSEPGKNGFFTETDFLLIYMELRGFSGFQEDRTDHTVLLAKFQPIWWYMGS